MRVRVTIYSVFTLLIFFLSYQTFSQTHISENKIQFKRLTHQEGFVANILSCMLQDRKGFLWMCPPDRLIRFDGKKQKLFRYSPYDEKSIGANSVRAIIEGNSGVLWFGTAGGGLNRYNSFKENFTRYTNNPDDPNSISSNDVYSIYEDNDGILWIGTYEGGLNKFDPKQGKFQCYKYNPDDPNSLSNNNVSVIFKDTKGNLWVGTAGGGLNKFNRKTQKFIKFMYNELNPNSLSHNNVSGILEDNYGRLWVATMGGGLNIFSFKEDSLNPVITRIMNIPQNPKGLSSNDISVLYNDKQNVIWIGTWGGGLNKLASNSESISSLIFNVYKHDEYDIFSLADNNVSCIYEDNFGIIWISTGGGGLHQYDKRRKQFRNYQNEPNNPFSLSSTAVKSIYEDRDGVRWIGMRNGGLNKMIKNTEKFIRYTHDPKNKNSLNDDCVSAIYEDKYGVLWAGTWNGGLNKLDKNTGKFSKYMHDPENPKSLSDNRVLTITEDHIGNLWIGTNYGGLNLFNRNDERFTHFRFEPNNPNSVSSDLISVLYCDKSGTLLIGTKGGGLDAFDQKEKKFIHYNLNPENSTRFKYLRINVIYEDNSGILWIGTFDQGLIKFDRTHRKIEIFDTKDGFPINYVNGILEDDNGYLWISTSIGVSKFNPNTHYIKTYIYEDGIQGMGETIPCKSRTGELIFGGTLGLYIFYPDSIKDFTHIPPVYITDLYLFNKKVPIGHDSLSKRTILDKSITECESVVLNYNDNILSFDFAIIDFHSLFKWNEFAYKMESFNKDWIYSDDNKRSVTYTNLDPGEYTLRIKAANSDNIWNEKGASLKLIILPPWYRTLWAYLIYVLLVFSITYIIWKTQLRRIKAKHDLEMSKFETKKLHEVDELKTRFFTNISHEFRTPLTLILGPARQLIEELKESNPKVKADLIHRSAKKLNKLVDELLDISKIEAGEMKLKASPIDLVSAVKEITISFSSLSERKKMNLIVNCDENKIIVYIEKDKFDKILGNVLSNAFKFTPEGGQVTVGVKRNEKNAEIIISDTGTGIPQNQIEKIFDRFYQVDGSHTREHEGTGIGLSLTKELVELHKGKIFVESEEGKGTTFRINFPLGKEHLRTEEIYEKNIDNHNGYEKKTVLTEFEESVGVEDKEKTVLDFSEEEALPTLLIIEDNSDVRKYISMILEKDYKILEARDGEEGLDKSFECIPDLIISDIMMPKLDGFQLCERLKTDTRTSHIPVIMVTAKATMKDKISGLEIGADEYIMKPFEDVELKARIKNLLEQRKRLHEHFRRYGLVEIDNKKITSVDQQFLQKAIVTINNHISDASFGVEMMADDMAVSRSLLFKKINSLLGEPPSEIIKRTRLNKAATLIEINSGNISEIALEVGFSNPSYFTECFRRQFGITPSQYHRKSGNS